MPEYQVGDLVRLTPGGVLCRVENSATNSFGDQFYVLRALEDEETEGKSLDFPVRKGNGIIAQEGTFYDA